MKLRHRVFCFFLGLTCLWMSFIYGLGGMSDPRLQFAICRCWSIVRHNKDLFDPFKSVKEFG